MRPAGQVMRLERLGSFHQSRLSFMRVLLRRLRRENWEFERILWDINDRGEGVAVYEARGNGRIYALVAFGHDLDPAKRTDRVIAEEWDATFVLHDGPVTGEDIGRLSQNVPRQEAGRCTASELVLARANRSVRLFDHVVDTLARGKQPEARDLDAVGYLMRTTAVYGSGKFGLADRERIAGRAEFAGPFAAEMLTVWLTRAFTTDLVEHMAKLQAPRSAVPFDRDLRRRLGVGNSTGLGMAPFVFNHPSLFHRWICARETALARVRSVLRASPDEIAIFRDRFVRGQAQMAAWRTDDADLSARITALRHDLDRLTMHVDTVDPGADFAWDSLFRFAEAELHFEAQEFLVTLLLEPYGDLVDDLSDMMAGDEGAEFWIDGTQTVAGLARQIDQTYSFAFETDIASPEAQARFWYVSEEKLEPRLGERASEAGSEREQPLAIARDVVCLRKFLETCPPDETIASLLARDLSIRHTVRRVQLASRWPYAEICDNLVDAAMRPIDILRCKLSFFGATDFDPRSDRWVRVALYRHAPFPDELFEVAPDDWAIPPAGNARRVRTTPFRQPCDARREVSSAAGYSLNEIEAQIRKAVRGAGLSWGVAEEAGKAARPLGLLEPDSLMAFAPHLEEYQAGSWTDGIMTEGNKLKSRDGRPLSPLILGPAIYDHAYMLTAGGLDIASPIAAPALLSPYLALLGERLGRAVVLNPRPDGIISVTLGSKPPPAIPSGTPQGGVAISPSVWAKLDRFAALTYVPATDTSRILGAGAGLTDND
ncbi:hypothetical protein BH10PSE7_BH10PSE7_18030 [soil metagenome]